MLRIDRRFTAGFSAAALIGCVLILLARALAAQPMAAPALAGNPAETAGNAESAGQPAAGQTVASQAGEAPPMTAAEERRDRLDLNTATARELRALPGMGDEYVRRIIAGRPYTAKNQLVNRGILPEGAYEQIAPLVVARRPKSKSRGGRN